jgi:hypothetical protein
MAQKYRHTDTVPPGCDGRPRPHPPPMLAPMARRKSLRSQLYRAARDLGNVEAADKGPTAYGKRVIRRKVYRSTNKVTGSFLRRLLG